MFPPRSPTRRRVPRRHVALVLACLSAAAGCMEDPHTETTSLRDAAQSPARDASLAAATTDAAVVIEEGEPAAATSDSSPVLDAGPGEPPMQAPAARGSLIDHRRWKRVELADDSFADAPSDVFCDLGATMSETLADEPVFSVDTGLCNYVTVSQPLLRAVAEGETLKVRLWHFELNAPMPAEAHAAVMVDGVSALDERIAIPSAGGLLTRELRATRALPAGAPVLFHLHNHGANSWALVEVSAGP